MIRTARFVLLLALIAVSQSAAAAERLVWSRNPAATTAGQTLAAVQVSIVDGTGAVVTGATNTITLALSSAAVTLNGTKSVAAQAGVATFSNLSVNTTGTYDLVASSAGFSSAKSANFAIASAAPASAAFGVEPSNAVAGVNISPAVTVRVADSFGNLVSSATAVLMSLGTSPAGATLSGATTVNTSHGVATFSNLKVNRPGSYTLVARLTAFPSVTQATSSGFSAQVGSPAKLTALSGRSQSAPAGSTLPAPLVALVTDSSGNGVPGVTVAWSAPAGGSVSSASVATDANGESSVSATLAPTVGSQAFQATAIAKTAGFTETATRAAPALQLSATSGGPGSAETATVSGFGANEQVALTYGVANVGGCATSASGACPIPFTVPTNDAAGAYKITAKGQTSGLTASATFNQNVGLLALSPLSGQPGALLSGSVLGFAAGETVRFAFGSAVLGTCAAGTSGSCSMPNGNVPSAAAAGAATVTATGLGSGITATASFTVVIPTIALNLASGNPGASFTASMTSFAAGETVNITYDGANLGSCSANPTGACSAPNLTAPVNLPGGTYTVTATGASSGLFASASFTQLAFLTLTSASGQPGAPLGASVNGFGAGETVQIALGTVIIGSCPTNAAGDCSTTGGQVPAAAQAGSATVTATGLSSGIMATASFTVIIPTITLSPSSGGPGSSFTASMTSFSSSETVNITYDSFNIGGCPASAAGACAAPNIQAPSSLAGGLHTVTATGASSGLFATATFNQNAGLLALSAYSGQPGAVLGASVAGFAAAETVQFSLAGSVLGTCSAGASGSCSMPNGMVPSTAPAGTSTVTATGLGSGIIATASFTVVIPTIALSPSSGGPGSPFSASMTSFSSGETVNITYDGVNLGSCSANSTGACSAPNLTAPVNLPGGTYTVTATGASSGLFASASFDQVAYLTLGSASGQPGESVGASVTGFGADDVVQINFGSLSFASCTANSAGDCGPTSGPVPSAVQAGSLTVTATGEPSGISATTSFTVVIPTIALNPSNGGPGSSLTASMTSFAAGEAVNITYDSFNIGGCTASAAGACAAPNIQAPSSLAGGLHMVTATGASSGLFASTMFNQNVGLLALTSYSGQPGAPLGLAVAGFAAGESVQLSFAGTSLGSCSASGSGACSTNGSVPTGAQAGAATVTATGLASSIVATATFTVEVATLTLNPASGGPGSPFNSSVTGFVAGETVAFAYDGISLGTSCAASSAGTCSNVGAAVPATLPGGPHTVTATGASSHLVASATFSQNAGLLTLAPTAGQPGATVGATLAGFAATELVQIEFGSVAFASCSTDPTGACITSGQVPGAAQPGTYTVTATGLASGIVGTATFTIGATLALSPATGAPNDAITATVAMFGPNEDVELFDPIGDDLGGCYSDNTGACSFVLNVAIGLPAGPYLITATGQTSGLSAAATFDQTGALLQLDSPRSSPGATLIVTAFGYAANETMQILFGGANVGSCGADPTGYCTTSITVPAVGAGAATVSAKGMTSGIVATASVTIYLTSLSLSPDSGAPDSEFMATIAGFFPAESIFLQYDDGPGQNMNAGYCVTDLTGACQILGGLVPVGLPAGTYPMVAHGMNSGLTARAPFNQNRAFVFILGTGSGAAGTATSVDGGGFGVNETVQYTYGNTPIGSCVTDTSGFCSDGFTIPAGPLGPYLVTGRGMSSGVTGTVTFIQTALLKLSLTSGGPGSSVTATIGQFGSNETVNFAYDGAALGPDTLGPCTTDSSGACQFAFSVPLNTGTGTYTVAATGATSGISVSTPFTQNAGLLILSSLSGSAGTSISATADGFANAESVGITFGSVPVASCAPDLTGSCSTSFSVPSGASGNVTVTAKGARSGIQASVIFTE